MYLVLNPKRYDFSNGDSHCVFLTFIQENDTSTAILKKKKKPNQLM